MRVASTFLDNPVEEYRRQILQDKSRRNISLETLKTKARNHPNKCRRFLTQQYHNTFPGVRIKRAKLHVDLKETNSVQSLTLLDETSNNVYMVYENKPHSPFHTPMFFPPKGLTEIYTPVEVFPVNGNTHIAVPCTRSPPRVSRDVWLLIFERLSVNDLLQCRMVSRRWKLLASHNKLWKCIWEQYQTFMKSYVSPWIDVVWTPAAVTIAKSTSRYFRLYIQNSLTNIARTKDNQQNMIRLFKKTRGQCLFRLVFSIKSPFFRFCFCGRHGEGFIFKTTSDNRFIRPRYTMAAYLPFNERVCFWIPPKRLVLKTIDKTKKSGDRIIDIFEEFFVEYFRLVAQFAAIDGHYHYH